MEQHLELEYLGILRQTRVPAELAWMSDAEKQLMLMLLLAGEEGLHKRAVTRFEKKNPGVLLNVLFKDFATWQTDKAGRPMFLALTWKGEETASLLLQIAKNENRKTTVNHQG